MFGRQQVWLQNRVRRWLWRKYDCTHGLFSFFTDESLPDNINSGASSGVRVAPIALRRIFSESRMREIRPSVLIRGGSWLTRLSQLLTTLLPLGSSKATAPNDGGIWLRFVEFIHVFCAFVYGRWQRHPLDSKHSCCTPLSQ